MFGLGYLRCDKRGLLFPVSSAVLQKDECPMVGYDVFDPKHNPFRIEIEFVSDTLAKHEQRVLKAWQKNAKRLIEKR